jgi:spore germination protein GerM
VFTVTEQPEVRRVHVRADQDPVTYVDATGRRIGQALVRTDFAELVQGETQDWLRA